jgi:ADP-glucose pyrophosphorylase
VSAKIFEAELKARIEEEITRLRINLGDGCAADYPQYLRIVGQIDAYNTVVRDYCDEVQTEINKR